MPLLSSSFLKRRSANPIGSRSWTRILNGISGSPFNCANPTPRDQKWRNLPHPARGGSVFSFITTQTAHWKELLARRIEIRLLFHQRMDAESDESRLGGAHPTAKPVQLV
jgi:hypothetical protein